MSTNEAVFRVKSGSVSRAGIKSNERSTQEFPTNGSENEAVSPVAASGSSLAASSGLVEQRKAKRAGASRVIEANGVAMNGATLGGIYVNGDKYVDGEKYDDADHAANVAIEKPASLTTSDLLVPAGGNRSTLYLTVKRIADIVGAALLLLMLSPILLITWVSLMITTKGSPLYYQERVGFRGRRFRMYKFRTMCLDADLKKHLVKNEQVGPIFKNRRDPRITRIGRILRMLSIDETPQLVSVLTGQMALVGPRPLPTQEVLHYEPTQIARMSVKPGLTCLWQVSGRSEVGYEDWMRMDLWYVENQGFKTDFVLLAKTPLTVLSCRGAY
jgi:lipopolysaccharide/colanic/teichoic acid biosynthesis glycosyltransferase